MSMLLVNSAVFARQDTNLICSPSASSNGIGLRQSRKTRRGRVRLPVPGPESDETNAKDLWKTQTSNRCHPPRAVQRYR